MNLCWKPTFSLVKTLFPGRGGDLTESHTSWWQGEDPTWVPHAKD